MECRLTNVECRIMKGGIASLCLFNSHKSIVRACYYILRISRVKFFSCAIRPALCTMRPALCSLRQAPSVYFSSNRRWAAVKTYMPGSSEDFVARVILSSEASCTARAVGRDMANMTGMRARAAF